MNETKTLAQFIADINYKDLTPQVIEKTKGLILDQLGCELAFATLPWNEAVYRYIKDKSGPRGESTIVYYGLKTTMEDAAFANAVFGHGFEMDDTEMHALTHPGSVVIPAALAAGEVRKTSGKDFITAIVAGYGPQRDTHKSRKTHYKKPDLKRRSGAPDHTIKNIILTGGRAENMGFVRRFGSR